MSPQDRAAIDSTARPVIGRIASIVALLCLAAASPTGASPTSEVAAEALSGGGEALAAGDSAAAEVLFRDAARGFEIEGDLGARRAALEGLAEAQRALGRPGDARASLELAIAVPDADDETRARLLGSLGMALVGAGEVEVGLARMEEAAVLAREAGAPGLEAAILNGLANRQASRGDPATAAVNLERALAAARRAGDPPLAAHVAANAARAHLDADQPERASDLLEAARAGALALPASAEKAQLLTNVGKLSARRAETRGPDHATWLLRAHGAFHEGAKAAHSAGSSRAESYAWGYMGELYEHQGRHADALELTRRALFSAQEADAPEALYRWQWQLGRIRLAEGDVDGALADHREAVRTLESIRTELSTGADGVSRFRDSVGPVYFGLIDLLLRRSDSAEPDERAALLADTRQTLESLKKAELRDYFRDDCVDALERKERSLDEVAGDAAVVYPVVLEDRLELLVTLPRRTSAGPASEIRRFTVPVRRDRLDGEIRSFRRLLEKRTTQQYLVPAQTLYRWIIEPIEAALEGSDVSAVVFVPDGSLRTVPMAALHDGERFFVERYPVAVVPGLDLVDPRPLDRSDLNLLAGGLSEARDGFGALTSVPEELRSLGGMHGGRTLLDEAFTLDRVRTTLAAEPVTVLHIASHGRFSSDVEDTYLLAYDDRLTMERLGDYVGLLQFRDRPLELLTLSACETAEGDERAALGLAGVAIRAGARSALGTLWKVDDVATARLVVDFYRELQDPQASRAVALQRAQKRTLGDRRYRHPSYWSAFLLISNWL